MTVVGGAVLDGFVWCCLVVVKHVGVDNAGEIDGGVKYMSD